ncbi:hypothetical protein D3C73_1081980 [compost metagenome]
MAKLAGQAGESLINLSINDDAAADAGSERIAHAVLDASARTAPCFPKRRHVGVIVYFDRLVQAILQNGADRHIPKTYVRRKNDNAFANIREAGYSRPNTDKLIPLVRGFSNNLTHVFRDVVNDGIDTVRGSCRPLKSMQ